MFSAIQPLDIGVIAACAVFVALFSGYRFPKELEGTGEGRLPKNFVASILFALINITFFILIAAIVFICSRAPIFLELILATAPDDLKIVHESIKKAAPSDQSNGSLIVASISVFFGLFGFQRWRQIEAGVLRQLHNISLVEQDAKKLSDLLMKCDFTQICDSGDESTEALDKLQRRVSPKDADAPERSVAAKAKKVSVLLQIWQLENWTSVLPRADQPNVSSSLMAHKRRLDLASRVNEYIEKIEEGEGGQRELEAIIASFDHGELDDKDIIEKVREISSSAKLKPSDEETLKQIITPLVEFFTKGYNEQLEEHTSATAKAVIMSGDEAQKKLEQLTLYGFSGIGRIEIIDLHLALLIVVLTFVIALMIFFGAPHVMSAVGGLAGEVKNQKFAFVIASSFTFAVVVGTMVGGLRSLANAPKIPWAWYFLAAFSASVTHVIAVLIANILSLAIVTENPDYQPVQFSLAGSVVPFAIVIGICLLSRRNDPHRHLPEYLVDGLCLAGFLFVAGFFFNVLVELAELPPPRIDANFANRMVIIGFVTVSIGAAVGSMVVHRVRAAALSSIVVEDDSGDQCSPTAPTTK